MFQSALIKTPSYQNCSTPNRRGSGCHGGWLFAAVTLWPTTFACAAPPTCELSSPPRFCNYTCDNASDDVSNIDSAIALVSGAGGGVVNVSAGTCQVATPVAFQSSGSAYPNVWLKGAGIGAAGSGQGGTIFQRKTFTLNQPMIQVNEPPSSGSSPTNENIIITDLTLDPKKLLITTSSPVSVPANSTSIQLPISSFTQQFKSFSGIGPGVYDFSQLGAVCLPANGNIVGVTKSNSNVTLQLASCPVPCGSNGSSGTCLPGSIASGDVLAFYSGGGVIDVEYTSGVQINNVQFLHGSAVNVQNDTDFVVSNNSFLSDNDFSTFFCLGGVFIGSNGLGPNNPEPNDFGMVVNNVFTLSGMEVDSFNTVVSGNYIQPTSCGGINGGIGEYNTFESNTLTPSLLQTTDTEYPSISAPTNHDNLFVPSMQITNPDALIADNLVYGGGCDGVYSAGQNNVISNNISYENSESTSCNNGMGGSGITLQGANGTVSNQYVEKNTSCNTNGSAQNPPSDPVCLSTSNTGPQRYALEIRENVSDTNVSYDNQFFPGAEGIVGNVYGSSLSYSHNLPEATISVSSCSLNSMTGSCTATVNWSSSNAGTATVYMVSSANLSNPEPIGSGSAGSVQVNIQNAIYAVRVESAQGLSLASATMQPTNYAK